MELYTTVYAPVRHHVATCQDHQHWISIRHPYE